MSRGKASSAKIPPTRQSNSKLVLLAQIAGAVGAGVTWMLLPAQHGEAPPVAPSAVAADIPPSVANLTPPQAALLLGHWHYDRQRWAAAVEQYEAALRLGIDNPDVRTDLGNCFRFLGQPEKARCPRAEVPYALEPC